MVSMRRGAARAFRTHIVGPVLAHVQVRGGDAAALAKRASLPAGAATAPWIELPLERLHQLLDAAAAAVGDDLLGIHVGQDLTRQTWDVLQMTSLSAPTLRSALAALPRLVALFNDAVEIRTGGSGAVTIEHSIAGAPDGLSRHGNELWVAALLRRAREATGAAVRPVAVWFAHRAPADVAAVARALDAPAPVFGAGATGVELSAADADRPLRTADPVLLGVLDRLVAPQLAALGDRRGLAAQVCRALDASLDDGRAGMAEMTTVARALGVSTRTLQRELTERGTSFRALVDHVRQTRARALLRDDVPLDEVAAQLGYSERSVLVRAFGRWTGRAD